MTDTKLSALNALTTLADDDLILCTDTSGSESKKITWANLEGDLSLTESQISDLGGTVTLNADTDVSANGWVVDEDDMATDSATKVPTQQSVKAYVDANAGSAPEGTAILSTGETGAVKFLREDGDGTCSWQVPAGSGDVSKVGTPVDSQIGVWTGDGTIEGTSGLTYDGSDLDITGNITLSGTVDGIDIATDVAANTSARHDAVTVSDSSEINFTLTGQDITGALIAGSVDVLKLDAGVQSSLGLADSALQSGDNVSDLTNDAGYITATLTNEEVQDIVGAMTTGNTETLITVTYQDADGTIDFVVDNDLSNYSNATSNFFDTAGTGLTSTGSTVNVSGLTTSEIASGSKTGSDTDLVTGTAGTASDLAIWNADGDLVDGPTPPSGTILGTTDTQTVTNKTIVADSNSVKIATEIHTANDTLTASECYGKVHYVSSAATLTLPAAAAGMHLTVITIGATAVSVDPNASDKIYLDGTALDDGDKITNTSTAGDIAVLTYYDSTGWHASTNSWTDGS